MRFYGPSAVSFNQSGVENNRSVRSLSVLMSLGGVDTRIKDPCKKIRLRGKFVTGYITMGFG